MTTQRQDRGLQKRNVSEQHLSGHHGPFLLAAGAGSLYTARAFAKVRASVFQIGAQVARPSKPVDSRPRNTCNRGLGHLQFCEWSKSTKQHDLDDADPRSWV